MRVMISYTIYICNMLFNRMCTNVLDIDSDVLYRHLFNVQELFMSPVIFTFLFWNTPRASRTRNWKLRQNGITFCKNQWTMQWFLQTKGIDLNQLIYVYTLMIKLIPPTSDSDDVFISMYQCCILLHQYFHLWFHWNISVLIAISNSLDVI